jgi:uncharacterized 2Fe-2S/4Fe-4S cluster protein (DUF4445 family)
MQVLLTPELHLLEVAQVARPGVLAKMIVEEAKISHQLEKVRTTAHRLVEATTSTTFREHFFEAVS